MAKKFVINIPQSMFGFSVFSRLGNRSSGGIVIIDKVSKRQMLELARQEVQSMQYAKICDGKAENSLPRQYLEKFLKSL